MLKYIPVDDTGLIHGPYECFEHARERADNFPEWEIVTADGGLLDWSPRRHAELMEAA